MTVKVLIADDHPIVREGIRMLLESEPDIEVVGEARDGREAIDQALALSPDIVLMDLAMPVLGGLEATQAIRSRSKTVRVLGLTVHEAPDYLFRMLQAGASGYMLKKDATSADLVRAIQIVCDNGIYLPPPLTKKLVEEWSSTGASGGAKGSAGQLSGREREVFKLVAEGHTNQEIAQMLSLSPHTVQTHRYRAMQKLDLHSRFELVRYAISQGIIDVEQFGKGK